MSQRNELVKMVTDSAVMVGLAAGVGYIAKKMLKERTFLAIQARVS